MLLADSFIASDGQQIRYWRWPYQKGRPTLHWAHATGFHARVYTPMLDALSEHLNIIAWDARGHGESRDAGDVSRFHNWQCYYDDLKCLLAKQEEPVWLAGHSVGGMTSLAAAAQCQDKVLGVLLVEPVIVDRFMTWAVGLGKLLRQTHKAALAAGAARRRPSFPDRQQAFDNYRQKSGFKRWPDSWLQHYVDHGFTDDNGEATLACKPEWESRSFTVMEHRPMRHIRRFNHDTPLHIVVGEKGSTFWPKARLLLQRHIRHADIEQFSGTSHFLPMEEPEKLVAWMLGKTAVK